MRKRPKLRLQHPHIILRRANCLVRRPFELVGFATAPIQEGVMKKLSTSGLVLYNLLAIVAATALVEAGAFLYLAHLDAKTASVRDPRAAEFPAGMQKLTFAKTRLYRVHAPFRSADYNVDDYGFRSVSGVRDALGAYDPSRFNIFAFGGSSTFGVGVKDGDTWPMILQAKLRQQLPRAAVFNLGLGGFSSADEMHLLVDLLAQNRTPAVAIFLDGGNEQCPAVSDRSAAYRVLEYGLLAHVIQASNAVRLWHRVADKWRLMSEGAAGPDQPIDYKTCGAAYSAQARLVTRLLAAYGAKALFFLQPIGALLPNFDSYQFWSYSNPSEQTRESASRLYAAVMQSADAANVVDLHAIMDEPARVRSDLFVDPQHPAAAGNTIIADAILSNLQPYISAPHEGAPQ
jgi:lysophospholipase L1-like esterase